MASTMIAGCSTRGDIARCSTVSEGYRPVLSYKFDTRKVPDLPLPRPMFEIWVCSPRVEGVHLRNGRIARGGIRWSDRREDFRTEILGLVKAQIVKNAVIVPTGAKGGFVLKKPPSGADEFRAEGVACYREFISGLLDVTDNIVGGVIVPPPDTVRHDGDDPYLVVAADKGTATFSDIANEISEQYGFWMGDAFASGGSEGYDHKEMAITARGAWESVRRHARALGKDADRDELAIVGMLGEAYSELGRWREALSTMRIAADRFSTDLASRHLRADIHTIDFVKEERSSLRLRDDSTSGFLGVRKSTARVPEQFAFDQGLRQSPAIYGNERSISANTEIV